MKPKFSSLVQRYETCSGCRTPYPVVTFFESIILIAVSCDEHRKGGLNTHNKWTSDTSFFSMCVKEPLERARGVQFGNRWYRHNFFNVRYTFCFDRFFFYILLLDLTKTIVIFVQKWIQHNVMHILNSYRVYWVHRKNRNIYWNLSIYSNFEN